MGRLLALDPGETTGWCLFETLQLKETGQFTVNTPLDFDRLIGKYEPQVIVAENYRVYASQAKRHVGSEVPTVQYLGVIKFVAEQRGIPLHLQMAFAAKGFMTDSRLRALRVLQTNRRHSNDAIRHAMYWLVFG